MKYIIIFLVVIIFSFAESAFSAGQIPSDGEVSSYIANYNRASPELATSGRLESGAVEALSKEGFATIIDLRTKFEGVEGERREVESAGMNYINIPVTGEGVDDMQLSSFSQSFETANKPVLVHCASGNRVGAMLTRYYISKGIPSEVAFERGRAIGMSSSLEKKIRSNLETNR